MVGTEVLSYTTPKRTRRVVEVPFDLDGERFTARKPKDSIMVYLGAATSENATTADRLYAAMQFINGCLTPAAQQRIQSRLRDYDDDLELDDLVQLMEDLSGQFKAVEDAGDAARAFKGVSKAGQEDLLRRAGAVVDGEVVPPNRAARRAAPKKTPAKKAAVKKAATTRTGRALPR